MIPNASAPHENFKVIVGFQCAYSTGGIVLPYSKLKHFWCRKSIEIVLHAKKLKREAPIAKLCLYRKCAHAKNREARNVQSNTRDKLLLLLLCCCFTSTINIWGHVGTVS